MSEKEKMTQGWGSLLRTILKKDSSKGPKIDFYNWKCLQGPKYSRLYYFSATRYLGASQNLPLARSVEQTTQLFFSWKLWHEFTRREGAELWSRAPGTSLKMSQSDSCAQENGDLLKKSRCETASSQALCWWSRAARVGVLGEEPSGAGCSAPAAVAEINCQNLLSLGTGLPLHEVNRTFFIWGLQASFWQETKWLRTEIVHTQKVETGGKKTKSLICLF